ncbi:MAG: preprotein translocase subunit SecY [Planctomycetota bacterium]
MFEPLINCFRIPELRKKIFFTLGMLVLFRIGTYVPIPGIDTAVVDEAARDFAGGALGLVNMFAGGALQRCAVFGLSIMPYISASIIFQLLATVIKPLEELQKEGEAGQRKINQYTRYATVLLCIVQALFMAHWIEGMKTSAGQHVVPGREGFGFELMCVVSMTAGTILLMWIGEQIQEHGIGNGISLVIMAGIIARMPPTVLEVWETHVGENLINPATDKIGIIGIGGMLLMYVAVVVGVVLLHQGQRRIAIQTAKQIKGRRVFGGQRYYLPLRVGAAGVIPIIFAQALLMFPSSLLQRIMPPGGSGGVWPWIWLRLYNLFNPQTNGYLIIYVLLIMFFCFFWTAVQFNPLKIADEMKERGNFIPGIRPGKRTAEYFERVMTRITLAGGAFISLIAIMPYLVQRYTEIGMRAAYIYGGTGILIVVGVALDLVQKIENHLLMRHYDGFLKGGTRIRGRQG